MESVRRRCGFQCGFEVRVDGFKDGMCLAWKEDIIVQLQCFSNHFIDVLVKKENDSIEWRFMGFYGSLFA